MILLRAIARLVAVLLLVALAIVGLAVAVTSLGSGAGFSIAGLAELVSLPQLEDRVRDLLDQVESPGAAEIVPALAGLGAMIVGLLLLIGALWPRRERLVTLEQGSEGTLAARRRALAQIAGALAEQARAVSVAKVKVRPRRRGRGGRLQVRAVHPRSAQAGDVEREATGSLEPLTSAFALKTKVRPRLAEGEARAS